MPPPNSHLTVREKIAYGLGDTASNFFFQFFNLFLLFYYTDVFGLSAAAVGTMFLVIRIFDAVMDPLVGMVADRTNSRWASFGPTSSGARCLTVSSATSCSSIPP